MDAPRIHPKIPWLGAHDAVVQVATIHIPGNNRRDFADKYIECETAGSKGDGQGGCYLYKMV
jgi:hypothetical protein